MTTTNDMLKDQCKHIAMELEAFHDGQRVRCEECGQWVEGFDDEGDEIEKCPECGADLYGAEVSTLGDYFEDCEIYNENVTMTRYGDGMTYSGCSLMVACGGPNVYIDTMEMAVKGYWWSDRAEYVLRRDVVDALDAWELENLEASGLQIN